MTTFDYSLGRYLLRSAVKLPLAAGEPGREECRLMFRGGEGERGREGDKNRQPDGAALVIREYKRRVPQENGFLYRSENGYLITAGASHFEIDLAHRSVRYQQPATEDLIVDLVLPEFLAGLGDLVLHGSAVLIEGRAVLLIGRSGSGKSTLAAALTSRGHALIADDFIPVVDEATIAPGSHRVNLWTDSSTALTLEVEGRNRAGKTQMVFASPIANRIKIATIVFLQPGDGAVSLTDCEASEALSTLMESRYVLDPFIGSEVESHLQKAAALVERQAAVRLHFPQDYRELPAVTRAIERSVMEYA